MTRRSRRTAGPRRSAQFSFRAIDWFLETRVTAACRLNEHLKIVSCRSRLSTTLCRTEYSICGNARRTCLWLGKGNKKLVCVLALKSSQTTARPFKVYKCPIRTNSVQTPSEYKLYGLPEWGAAIRMSEVNRASLLERTKCHVNRFSDPEITRQRTVVTRFAYVLPLPLNSALQLANVDCNVLCVYAFSVASDVCSHVEDEGSPGRCEWMDKRNIRRETALIIYLQSQAGDSNPSVRTQVWMVIFGF